MSKDKIKSPRELVMHYYPNAVAVNIGTKRGGNYYNIKAGSEILGQGKTSKAAWTASWRNIN